MVMFGLIMDFPISRWFLGLGSYFLLIQGGRCLNNVGVNSRRKYQVEIRCRKIQIRSMKYILHKMSIFEKKL